LYAGKKKPCGSVLVIHTVWRRRKRVLEKGGRVAPQATDRSPFLSLFTGRLVSLAIRGNARGVPEGGMKWHGRGKVEKSLKFVGFFGVFGVGGWRNL
jgi:hypothetical protein